MAVLSYTGIKKSAFSTGKPTSLASKTIKNISNILINKTSSKKNISNNILRYKNKRNENERRMQAQSELFASSAITRPGGSSRLALSQVGGSFLSRIMQFAGFLTAGWILTNMPTWIAGANELSNRIQSLSSTFTGFVDNIWDMMADIGRISGALYENMKMFDLTDSSSRVRNSMTGLIDTLDSMGDQIKEAFSVLTEPFMNVPPLGTKAGPGAYADVPPADSGEPPPSGGGGGGSNVSGSDAKLLSFISKGEGDYNSMNQGTRGGRIVGSTHNASTILGRNLTDMTVEDIMKEQSSGRLFAAGRYQIIPSTMKLAVEKSGVSKKDKFDARTQDKLGLALIYNGQRPTLSGYLTGKNNNLRGAMLDLALEWASAPHPDTGRSAYPPENRSSHTVEEVKEALISARKGGSRQQSPQSPQSSPQPEQRATSTPTRTIKPTITGRYGDLRGSRRHGGTDLATNYGTPVTAVADGKIIETGWENGWGYFLVYREDKSGLYHLYGHMPKGTYKTSGQVKKGEVIGKVGSTGRSTGPHLHWEVGKSWNGTIGGKFDPLNIYSSSAPFTSYGQSTPSSSLVPSSTPSTTQTPSEVQIESPETGYDLLSEILLNASLAANKQDIVLINDLQPATTQMSGGSGGGATLATRVSQSDLVNSFIKNKLLLDLNYL